MNDPQKDMRWKQRFQNFRRAFNLLREALEEKDIAAYSALEQEGIIQRFEYTFELGWKTLKDYLDFAGASPVEATPRKVIKECATLGIFNEAGIDGEVYLEMMLSRNALSHVYDFKRFVEIITKMKNTYLPELEKEFLFFLNMEPAQNE